MKAVARALMGWVYEGNYSTGEVYHYVIGQTPTARRLRMQTSALMLRWRVR